MRERKRQRLQQLSAVLASQLLDSGLESPGWLRQQLNNARLAAIGLYELHVADFRELYAACEQQLECFYERASSLRLSARRVEP